MNYILQKFPTILELKKLIMHTSETVWKREITEKEIDRWLANFIGEVLTKNEEDILALWLLANFVYYNEDEVRHLCRVLMKDFIHKMLIDLNTQQDEINENISKIISKTRFLYLGKPSESGGYILYYYRQVNDLHISCFNPPQLSDLSSIDNFY